MLTLSAMVTTFVVSTVLPLIIAFVTKRHAPNWVKQVVSIAAAAVTAIITAGTQLDGTAVISKETVILAFTGLVTQITTYLGLYKPNSVSEFTLPGFGLGPAGDPDEVLDFEPS